MKTVLVTGSAGFIGYHVSKKLLERGDTVIGFDNFNAYYDAQLKENRNNMLEEQKNFTVIRGDLENVQDLEKAFQLLGSGPDTRICHLAAQAGVRHSIENPQEFIQSNIVGFGNIIELTKKNNIGGLIYASTSSVYGDNKEAPFSESHRTDAQVSLYGMTKKANELMAHTYSHLFGLPTTGLRFFTVYGPWGRPDMAMWIFTKAILAGQPIDVFNHGKMRRDFTFVDDIVEGVIRTNDTIPMARPMAADADDSQTAAPYRVYNIGNNQPVELMHLIEILEAALGRTAVKNMLPMQLGDVPATFADIEALQRDVGFRPSTPIEEGVRKFVDWYRRYHAL